MMTAIARNVVAITTIAQPSSEIMKVIELHIKKLIVATFMEIYFSPKLLGGKRGL